MVRRAVAALLLLLALACAPAQAQTTETRTIAVQGTASRQVPNDTGRFTASVVIRRGSASGALSAAARRTRRVLSELGALGIARRDLRTGTVSVRRLLRFDRRTRRNRLVGYEARNSVRVTVRDLTRMGAAIDAAVSGGATGIGSLVFFVSNAKSVYREVLGAAFDDARAKAELLAARAGLTLGPARAISEGSEDFVLEPDAQGEAPASPEESTPIRPGRSTVEATVSVVFDAS